MATVFSVLKRAGCCERAAKRVVDSVANENLYGDATAVHARTLISDEAQFAGSVDDLLTRQCIDMLAICGRRSKHVESSGLEGEDDEEKDDDEENEAAEEEEGKSCVAVPLVRRLLVDCDVSLAESLKLPPFPELCDVPLPPEMPSIGEMLLQQVLVRLYERTMLMPLILPSMGVQRRLLSLMRLPPWVNPLVLRAVANCSPVKEVRDYFSQHLAPPGAVYRLLLETSRREETAADDESKDPWPSDFLWTPVCTAEFLLELLSNALIPLGIVFPQSASRQASAPLMRQRRDSVASTSAGGETESVGVAEAPTEPLPPPWTWSSPLGWSSVSPPAAVERGSGEEEKARPIDPPLSVGGTKERVQLLLPKLSARAVLTPPGSLHVGRNTRRIAKRFSLSTGSCLDRVIEGCHAQHGEGWLYSGTARALLRASESRRRDLAQIISVECWQGSELVAGEIGAVNGTAYTSLSGFAAVDGAGSVQLAALAGLLHLRGVKFWDLGMEMAYKLQLGARVMPRRKFYVHFLHHRAYPNARLELDGRLSCKALLPTTVR